MYVNCMYVKYMYMYVDFMYVNYMYVNLHVVHILHVHVCEVHVHVSARHFICTAPPFRLSVKRRNRSTRSWQRKIETDTDEKSWVTLTRARQRTVLVEAVGRKSPDSPRGTCK